MKRKRSQEHRHYASDRDSAHHGVRTEKPDQIDDLQKQYEELCQLREQVRKAERLILSTPHRTRALPRIRPPRFFMTAGTPAWAAVVYSRRSIVYIINSKGIHVANVIGSAIFDLRGGKLYELKGINIYRLSGDLVGHLNEYAWHRDAA